MMHSHIYRFIEIAACASGILLLAAYIATRTWSAYASEEAIEAMRRARAGAETQTLTRAATDSSARALLRSSAQPDTSTWSPKRLAEYRETLRASTLPEAVLRIPKLSLEVPVFGDTSDFALNRGAGWIEGTASAASRHGNVGIAAHRDGFFRPLKDIAVGDELTLETVADVKHYRVTAIQIVDPREVGVLRSTPDATLTLVTCYPFYHVGAAPKRFIVQARSDDAVLATDDEPTLRNVRLSEAIHVKY